MKTAILCLWAVTPVVAFGYVDPGSGYLIMQLGLSFIAGILFFLPRTVARVWKYLTGK